MAGAIDRTSITITLSKDTDLKCYPPVAEFLKFLTEVLSGEVQGNFGDVVLSNMTPDSDQVNKLWIETNGQRNDFDQKFFINGKWQPWYFPPPNTYYWFDGRAALPLGFKELGRVKASDLPITGADTAGSLPTEFILASFIGY